MSASGRRTAGWRQLLLAPTNEGDGLACCTTLPELQWRSALENNAENLLVIRSPELATKYSGQLAGSCRPLRALRRAHGGLLPDAPRGVRQAIRSRDRGLRRLEELRRSSTRRAASRRRRSPRRTSCGTPRGTRRSRRGRSRATSATRENVRIYYGCQALRILRTRHDKRDMRRHRIRDRCRHAP